MLAAVAVVGIATQAPTAIFLETKLHAGTSSLLDIFTIGLPEELAKAIPIVVVAWIWRRYWHTQTPRDYLFLGAVSGLVFGAAEVVHYFTDVLGSISGNATGRDLQSITIQYVWRFLTDPIDHACWAGITGYFIGLAITGPYRKYSIGLVGIGIAAVLHGLNDWDPINSHPAWVLVTLISVLLFLGYARAGAWLPEQAIAGPDGMAVPAGPTQAQAYAQRQAQPRAAPAPWAAAPPAPPPARPRAPTTRDEWWQHVPAATPPPQPAAAAPRAATPSNRTAPPAAAPYNPATAPTVMQRKPPVRPWWEQER
jgi:RsiW-degrading membrane proteinase PrsW (M82 family)